MFEARGPKCWRAEKVGEGSCLPACLPSQQVAGLFSFPCLFWRPGKKEGRCVPVPPIHTNPPICPDLSFCPVNDNFCPITRNVRRMAMAVPGMHGER